MTPSKLLGSKRVTERSRGRRELEPAERVSEDFANEAHG